MKGFSRIIVTTLSALFGPAVCVGLVKLDEWLRILPRPSSTGGEDAASLRAAAFFLFVCPAFLVLGAALGWIAASDGRRALRAWAGVMVGSIAAFATARLGAGLLASPSSPNAAYFVFLVLWCPFATGGAYLGARSRGVR